ncbi:MAG: DNA polymerase ligase N-terminal domain-containing protein [Rhizomicrobium sp.]
MVGGVAQSMRPLAEYQSKRDFSHTAEPRGKRLRARGKTRRFVIQRHDATRLHFDLRLELDGVYKSWAVTKVPSLDPAVKRLAVEVEDHPLDYGTFEGTIPKGEYGGGTVQLWDRGTWTPQGDTSPEDDLAKGHLKFDLDGERMQGGWALVRMKDDPRKPGRKVRHNWLLIKEKDSAATPGKPDTLLKADTSVKTGRTLEEIASGAHKVWHSDRGKTAALRSRAAKPSGSKKKKRKAKKR